jgi:hypothetical protein
MGNVPGPEFKEHALENDLDEVEALLGDHPDLLNWVDEVNNRIREKYVDVSFSC